MSKAEFYESLQPRNLGLSSSEMLLLLGAIGVIVVLFVAWAVFIRKRPRQRSPWVLHSSSGSESGDEKHGHRRHRRRRRERRNPTLAETGGLPPARPEPPSAA